METELSLSIGGFPPMSARGCTQELMPVNDGEFCRTVNGELIFLNSGKAKKYKTIIRCEDKTALATDGLHRGCDIKVGCIQRLWQKVEKGVKEIYLEKDPIKNSVSAIDTEQNIVKISLIEGKKVILHDDNFDKEIFISYRPILQMKTINYKLFTNEWGVKVGWQLELEEV
jgi:hypothetical protein